MAKRGDRKLGEHLPSILRISLEAKEKFYTDGSCKTVLSSMFVNMFETAGFLSKR